MKKTRISLWIGISVFLWYLWANVYRILSNSLYGSPMSQIYTLIWALPILAWGYLLQKKIELKPKFSWLSTYSIIMIVVFFVVFMGEFARKTPVNEVFLTGTFDHIFFPIAFGLLFLFDVEKIPKEFWAILIPFALFNAMPLINILANLLLNTSIVPGGCPGFFDFFGATSWADFEFSRAGFSAFVREFLTFFTLFPGVIFYYFSKNYFLKKKQ